MNIYCNFKSMIYVNGVWFAFCEYAGSKYYYYSIDGKKWILEDTSYYFCYMTYANGIFVANDYSKGLCYSEQI